MSQQQAFEKEALSLREKVKKNLQIDDSWLYSLDEYLSIVLLGSIFPALALAIYLVQGTINLNFSFTHLWMATFSLSLAAKLISYFTLKKMFKAIDPEKELSVYSYLIHKELVDHSNTSDQDIFNEAQKLNKSLLTLWRKTYLVNGKLGFYTDLEANKLSEGAQKNLVIKIDKLKRLNDLQHVIQLFKLDADANTFFDAIEQVENRLFLNLKAGFNFPEFKEAFFYLAKTMYLLRNNTNSLEEIKESLTNLTKVMSSIPRYVPQSSNVEISIKDVLIKFLNFTYQSKFRAIRLIFWFVTFFIISIVCFKKIVVPYLGIDYQQNIVGLLGLVITISGGAAIFLSSKEKV